MNKIVDIFTFALVVAGIMVLTRPGSQGPGFVSAIGSAFASIVTSATGGGAYHPSAVQIQAYKR